ncbi:MAG TPA: DUF4397 domain-containing protein [Chitinophagaceae bacterium]|nr:DUF4397 domain-containing protein [Chitinophagaceae bacterium]
MKPFFSVFRSRILSISFVLAGSAVMLSCSKFNDDNNQNVPVAGLMAFNLAPDQSSLILTLNGSNLTNFPLAYTNYTGGYLSVYPGNRTLDAYSSTSSSEPIATASANLEPKKYYSSFTIGANNNYRNVIVHDNFDTLTATGQSYIRYINAIPDSSRPTVTITAGGMNVVSQQPAFGFVADFVAIAPGQVSIDITNGGTIDADRTITVEQNKLYTVLLTGLPGTTPAAEMIKFIQNGALTEQLSKQSSTRSAIRSN